MDSLRSAIRKDIGGVTVAVAACHTVLSNLRKIADDFSQHVGHVKATVESAVEELRNRVDQDEDKMLTCLNRIRENAGGRFLRDKQEVGTPKRFVCRSQWPSG